MVKTHNCLIEIDNKSGMEMEFRTDWFDSGRLADDYEWPNIQGKHQGKILCYERDNSLAGCSGYVTYKMGSTEITIAFSNPVIGYNKLGVGTGGKDVWDNMSDHDYHTFNVFLDVSGVKLVFRCKCTGGTTNVCTVEISPDK